MATCDGAGPLAPNPHRLALESLSHTAEFDIKPTMQRSGAGDRLEGPATSGAAELLRRRTERVRGHRRIDIAALESEHALHAPPDQSTWRKCASLAIPQPLVLGP